MSQSSMGTPQRIDKVARDLKQINELRDQGKLTEEDHSLMRAAILKGIVAGASGQGAGGQGAGRGAGQGAGQGACHGAGQDGHGSANSIGAKGSYRHAPGCVRLAVFTHQPATIILCERD